MVIQVLETMTKEEEKKREKSWLCAANTSSVWHTGLSGGAPNNVRCARLADGETTALRKTHMHTAIIHRTVQWCTGLFGEPTVTSATVGRAIRGRRVARSNGRLDTPDCPVRQPTPRANGRMRQKRKEIAHRTATLTIWWCTGLSDAPPDIRQV
jgi:hypothetical protein